MQLYKEKLNLKPAGGGGGFAPHIDSPSLRAFTLGEPWAVICFPLCSAPSVCSSGRAASGFVLAFGCFPAAVESRLFFFRLFFFLFRTRKQKNDGVLFDWVLFDWVLFDWVLCDLRFKALSHDSSECVRVLVCLCAMVRVCILCILCIYIVHLSASVFRQMQVFGTWFGACVCFWCVHVGVCVCV